MTQESKQQKASEIGYFSDPSAPTDVQRSSPKHRGSLSPYRQVRQEAGIEKTESGNVSAFSRQQIRTKQKATVGPQIGTAVDMQLASGIVNYASSQMSNVSQQQASKTLQQVDENGEINITSEVLHFMANPQILVNHVTNAKELPRSIALERRRREIAGVDFLGQFVHFIAKVRKDDEDFLLQNHLEESQLKRLPIEMFDDNEFETKTVAHWFAGGRPIDIYDASRSQTRTVRGLYGHCWIQQKWQKCMIIGSRKTHRDDRLLVQLLQTQTQAKYWVPRLYVFIWGEDPAVYNQRLEKALTMRNQCESLIRYDNYIQNMPVDGLVNMDPAENQHIAECVQLFDKRHIVMAFTADEYTQFKQMVISKFLTPLLNEVNNDYLISQNRILFKISLQKQPSLIQELQLNLAVVQLGNEQQHRYNDMRQAIQPYIYMTGVSNQHLFIPENTQINVNNRPVIHVEDLSRNIGTYLKQRFNVIEDKISFESFLLNDEAIKSLQITQAECFKLLRYKFNDDEMQSKSLSKRYSKLDKLTFDQIIYDFSLYFLVTKTSLPQLPFSVKTYSIEEFKNIQSQHQKQLASYLSEQWIVSLKNQLIECFRNSGKGHYNIFIENVQVYETSKLKGLLVRIMQQCCDTLRNLTYNSVRQFTQMFDFQGKWKVTCEATNEVYNRHKDNDYAKTLDLDVYETCFRQPIFNINLSVEKTQPQTEDKLVLDRLRNEYIYGVSPLKEEPQNFEDSESEQEEVKDENTTAEEILLEAPPEPQQQQQEQQVEQKKKETKKDVEDIATIDRIAYQTPLDDFKTAVLTAFDNGFSQISKIPTIEPLVLQSLVYPKNAFIMTPNPQEQRFVEDRVRIVENLDKALAPLTEYTKTFNKYKELLYTDIDKWRDTIQYKAELYLQQQKDAENVASGVKVEEEKEDTNKANLPPNMLHAIETAMPLSPADLRNLVHKKLQEAKDILNQIPEQVHIGAFIVKNHSIRALLSNKCNEQAKAITQLITNIASTKSTMISQVFFAINRKLNHKCKNLEEVCKIDDFIKSKVDTIVQVVKSNISVMNEYYSILDELFLAQKNDDVNRRWKTAAYPRDIKQMILKAVEMVNQDKNKFKEEQQNQQSNQVKNFDNATRTINGFPHKYKKIEDFVVAADEAEKVMADLVRMQNQGKQFNKRENLLGLPITSYQNVDIAIKEFEPIAMIWRCLKDFRDVQNKVMNQDFKAVNASEIENQIDNAFRNLSKAQRQIKENQQNLRDLSDLVKQEINEFKKHVPLIVSLRNPGLRKRHWLKIGKEIAVDLRRLRYINGVELKQYGSKKTDEEKSENDYTDMTAEQIDEINKKPVDFTFKQALEEYKLNDIKKVEIIQKVSDVAAKEFGIETVLKQLDQTWGTVCFTLLKYQNGDTYILKALDEIIQQLDDNITMIQSMSFSPFKKYFEEAISSWDYKLSLTSEIIDIWIQVQQAWLYLEPIFASPDIVKQLPNESKNFKTVDSFWQKFMNQTFKLPNVIKVCTETEKLLFKLKENHKILETVQKGLADYLETKRIAFPRFFFLSDEELLSILSNTKNPTSVQPFLRSCFENVARIKFLDENYEMVSMTSHEGEIVTFSEPLVPEGNVEIWMSKLEKLIIKTVKVRTLDTLKAYVQMVVKDGIKGRAQWVKTGFAQGINLVNQIMFCNDTEWAIQGEYLQKYADQLDRQLSIMTDLVREGLSKLESKCFSALLTYDVFQRDVVDGLIQNNVDQVGNFDWSRHPKHYCNVESLYLQPIHQPTDNYYDGNFNHGDYSNKNIKKVYDDIQTVYGSNFQVSYCQILSTLPYAFEYLGNTQRLVITPLTLKIYVTISQSQAMFKFSAASGPAGSGKTETSKQMTNKEFGLVCVVFNCSEGLDLIGIRRMLSGVISTGGCLVMDEINRLSLDVLSVFAQMVLSVQIGLQTCGGSIVRPAANAYGKQMAHIQTQKFVFEGTTELMLQSTATVIITQNPNYSGRQKLPANLVALFRAVSVMVPNYMKICQIRLYSFGFKKAAGLAQKAVSVFKLCSEQLSQQSWYDYGMRAINTTIQSVGNIRQELGNMCVQNVDQIPLVPGQDGVQVPDQKYYIEDQIMLRAISETNLPKFLANDSLLFNNILKDLFPGIKQPYIDYSKLVNELNLVLRSNTMDYLQHNSVYVDKIVDLYMTINLRHGLMTLGNACSGKTSAIYSLMHALNRLNKKEVDDRLHRFNKIVKQNPNALLTQVNQLMPEDFNFMKMGITKLNPKSITMDQLFGQFDPVSKEWQDGVLSTCIRNAVADYNKYIGSVETSIFLDTYDQSKLPTVSDVNPAVWIQRGNYTRQIVYVCGYIDSLWIESLNTVLDDSKRLCLTSGEIIALSPVMNLLFTMDSVAEASPATISRNGMIYFTSLDFVSVGTTKEKVGEVIVNGTLKETDYYQTYIDRLPDQFRVVNPQLNDPATTHNFESKCGVQEEYTNIAIKFQQLFQNYLKDIISYLKVNCKQLQVMMDANLILSVFKIINSYIREVKANDFGVIDNWQLYLFEKYQEDIFLFSLIWGIGGTIADDQSRVLFDKYLRIKMIQCKSTVVIPTDMTVFDFEMTFPSYESCKEHILQELGDDKPMNEATTSFTVSWKPWGQEKLANVNLDLMIMGNNPDMKMISKLNLSEIIIPTPSNISQSILLRRFIQNQYATIVVGGTGSGKTSVIKNYLMKHEEDTKTQVPIIMNFSANTQAGDVMNYMDSKLEKRRRGVYGAPSGKKYVFYVDDLNLPMKERYGCINSHEFLRQMISHGGWYDLKEIQFKTIIDTTLVSSMVQAGGSRNPVTQRLLRHFVLLNFLEMGSKELQRIFGQLINWWTDKVFPSDMIGQTHADALHDTCQTFISASIDIYNDIRSNLLPTPSKMHYTFNLRDLTKLFQGFLMIEPSSIFKKGEDADSNIQCFPVEDCISNLVKLFAHENLRVFNDRLVNEEDQLWFLGSLDKIVSQHMNKPFASFLDGMQPNDLLFGDFVSHDRSYQIITSIDEAQIKLYEELASYNDQHSKNPMNLVLFKTAIQHLSRLARILRQPNSNLLIIGVGGVGRLSLTSLASSLLQYDIQTIELKKGYGINDWHNDLKELLLVCGLQQKQRVFLVQDAHIFSDRQLEDISIMLNSCDLQSYYEQADLEAIYNDMKQECIKLQIPQTKINMYDCFLKRVKENLRIVLCFSPSGTTLRDRLRKFPSLVNCCSIDYMFDWPVDALTGVGQQVLGFTGKTDASMIPFEQLEFLKSFLKEQVTSNPSVPLEQLQLNITNFCVQTHRLVEEFSQLYEKEVQRYNRVTPTLFLNQLEMIIKVIQATYNQINTYKIQLSGGLEKLESTQVQVAQLQVELQNLQPELIKQTEEVEAMMVKLKADEEVAMQAQAEVTAEKAKANEKLVECQTIERESNQKREAAEKKLESAKVALRQLDVSKLAEVGGINIPVPNVRLCTDAVCVLMGLKTSKKVANPVNQSVQIDDYWDTSKAMLSKANVMINDLLNFKKEEITEVTIKRLQPYITDPRFNEKTIGDSSRPCASLAIYVLAMVDFYHNFQQVVPLRIASEKAAAELAIVQANLDELMTKLNTLNAKINQLKEDSQAKVRQKQLLLNQVEETSQKLNRAQTLISSLSGEKSRWVEQLKQLGDQGLNVLGDSLFAASYSVYSGAFTSDYRKMFKDQLLNILNGFGMKTTTKHGQEVKVTDVLTDQVTLMNYVNQFKLPSDQHSQENAAIMFNSIKYCLLIDPEAQAQQFLKNYYREQGFEICKANNKDLLRSLENCIRFGKVMIIVNVTNEIDPSLNSVLDRQLIKEGSQFCIKLGDAFIPYNNNFRLFLCTHLPNPNYKPESFVKVTVLNFAITLQGLQDQMLGVLVGLEKPDQEQLKNSLVISNSKKRVELKQLEDKVLELLNNSTGDILDNIELINTLAQSQKTSAQIMQSVKESEATEAIIDETRKSYIPVAERASILYFCIQDLVKIDFMYQYSLNWYIDLYVQSIHDTEPSPDNLEKRLANLIEHFTVFSFQTICRSLFEVHRLLFAFLMCTRVQLNEKQITNREIKYLLVGPQASSAPKSNPAPDWISEKTWIYICDLENTMSDIYGGITQSFQNPEGQAIWKNLFEHQLPEEQPFPEPFQSNLSSFQRFMPLQAVRPDRVISYTRIYLVKTLGGEFIQPQTFNLEKSFKDSNNVKPILFLLNDMADPISDLMNFATTMRMNRKIQVLSLGRGIEKAAIQLIQQFAERGSWCVLQNCHLSVSFLKTLEHQLEQLQGNAAAVHRDFRLWLSSQPSEDFPVSILQNSVKVSVENPNNLKSNLLRVWQNNISEKMLQESCHVPENVEKYKKLSYSLSLFYAVLLQRKKYGSVGFNTPYPWSAADVAICIQQLPTFLDKYLEEYPKEAFNYLFAGINIGGCVTDAIDQRCVDAIVVDFLDQRIYTDNWVFQQQKIKNDQTPPHFLHQLSSNMSYRDYLDYIQQNVPVECHPENLGMNSNSNITADINESNYLLQDILKLYAGKMHDDKKDEKKEESTSQKQASTDDETIAIQAILKQVPKPFDIDAVQLKYPTLFEESLNSLLVQECGRYNNLLITMDQALHELIRALKGLTILSPELEEVQKAITLNKQPELFQKYSYPSLKPLSSYMKDLNMRIHFFNNWIEVGKPKIYNITSFFFAQGFLTSLLQNFARKYSIAIDTIGFSFSVTATTIDDLQFIDNGNKCVEQTSMNSGDDGTFMSGFYLEAARYDLEQKIIVEARPRELYSKMPVLLLTPTQKEASGSTMEYTCPCYRTLARFGTLSTTGHSTNFLLNIQLPCASGTARHWIKRSVALFASLSD